MWILTRPLTALQGIDVLGTHYARCLQGFTQRVERVELEWKDWNGSCAATVCTDAVLLFEMVGDMAEAVTSATGKSTAPRAKKRKTQTRENHEVLTCMCCSRGGWVLVCVRHKDMMMYNLYV